MNVKLGKKKAVYRPHTRLLSRYLKAAVLPAIPGAVTWDQTERNWQMLGNDKLGDCTCAGPGHIIMEQEIANGQPITVTTDAVIKAYEDVGHYVPGDATTDQGAVIADVLDYWKATGICGNKIIGYASIGPTSIQLIKAGIYLFGNVNVGIQLPLTAESQTENNQPWTLTPGYQYDPKAKIGSWGGHCVPIFGFDAQNLYCVTWGQWQSISIPWFQYYCDEAYAVFDQTWLGKTTAPNGLALTQLQEDFAIV